MSAVGADQTDRVLARRPGRDQALRLLDDERDQQALATGSGQRAGRRPVVGTLGAEIGIQRLGD
jgi:hypothetical protein